MPLWLIRFAPQLIGAAAVIGLALMGYNWSYGRGEADGDARAATAEARASVAESSLKAAQKAAKAATEASKRYQNELEALRSRSVSTTPVRLCRPAATSLPAAAPAKPGSTQAAPAAGVVPGGTGEDFEQGPDIGPDLRALAKLADELSAQTRALIQFEGSK